MSTKTEQRMSGAEMRMGARVRVQTVLTRQWVDKPGWRGGEWQWLPEALPEPVEGLFMGWRNQQNGYTDYDPDDGNTFISTASVRCALVVTHPWRNPLRVPVDALSSTTETPEPTPETESAR